MKYHVKQNNNFINLKEHILEYGQIEKIIIYKNSNREFIIDGVKRVESLENPQKIVLNSLMKAYKLLLSSKEIPESSIWKMILKLKDIGIDEKEIGNELLKDKFKISIRDIWKLTQIEYSKELEDMFFNLKITLKELRGYYLSTKDDLLTFFSFFETINLNKNNRKDFFTLLNEISQIDKITIKEVLNREKVLKVLNSELQNNEKTKLLKKILFSFRYPNINREIEYLTNLKFKVKTPSIKLDLPIDIESNRCSISFKFKDIEGLKKISKTISNLTEDKHLIEILEVVKKR
jgi:hypothetical protein